MQNEFLPENPNKASSTQKLAEYSQLVTPPYKPSYGDFTFSKRGTKPKPCLNPVIEGWDSETDGGVAKVIANSEEWRLVDSLESCLEFVSGGKARGKKNFWWKLDYDVTAIFKHDLDALKDLVIEGRWCSPGIDVKYLPHKLLKIRKAGKDTIYHYDMLQFYLRPLEEATRKYLKRSINPLKHQRADLWKNSLGDIGAYCQWDALQTRDLSIEFVKGLHAFGMYPRNFLSSGNLAQQFLTIHADVPIYLDQPKTANVLGWKTFRGGWFDLWKRGVVNGWKADLKSAYPAVLKELPDTRDGYWVPELVRESSYGFVKCVVKYSPGTIPILQTWVKHELVYPFVDKPTLVWVTIDEFRYLERKGSVTKVLASYCFVSKECARKPWLEPMNKLQKFQEMWKGDPARYMGAKNIKNSTYGKTCQRVETRDGSIETGGLFNPPVASTITAKVRCWVAEALDSNPKAGVMIATDCVVSDRPLSELRYGKEIGDWVLENECSWSLFLQPGIYEMDGSLHSRGWREKRSLFYVCKGAGSKIDVKYSRPWSSREAFHHNDLEKANVFHEASYTCNILNTKRLWHKEIKTFSELLETRVESSPIPLSLLEFEDQP